MDVFALTMRLRTEGEAAVRTALTSLRKQMKETEKSALKLDKATDGLSDRFKSMGAALATIAGGAATVRAIDAFTRMQNQIRLATNSSEEFAKAQADVVRIANQTGQPLEDISELYGKTARAAGALGLNQQQVAKLTETFSKALLISGSNAGTAAGALTQLGQALSAGVVRAEEFNSIMEGAPALIQAVEKDLGLLPGQLRQLALEGKLSSDVFAQAMVRNTSITDQFSKTVQPISAELGKLRNQFVLLAGNVGQATGATTLMVQVITWLRDNLPTAIALIGSATAAWVAYRGAVIGAAIASAAITAAGTIKAFVQLAATVRNLASAAALLSMVSGNWVTIAAAIGGAGAAYGAFTLIQDRLNKIMEENNAKIEQQTATLGQTPTGLPEIKLPSLGGKGKEEKSYIELLAEFAKLGPILTREFELLKTKQEQLTKALADGNLTLEQRRKASEELQAITEGLAAATIKYTDAERAAVERQTITPDAQRFQRLPLRLQLDVIPEAVLPEEAFTEAEQQAMALGERLGFMFRDTLVNGISSALETIVQKGANIGDAFRALGSALLRGFGDMLVQFGTFLLPVSKIFAKLVAAFSSLNPVAMAAAGVGFIAIGSLMKGAAGRIAGGGGGGGGGGYSAPSLSVGSSGVAGMANLYYAPTAAGSAATVQQVPAMNITIIGPNDPSAQRQMQELMRNAQRRGEA